MYKCKQWGWEVLHFGNIALDGGEKYCTQEMAESGRRESTAQLIRPTAEKKKLFLSVVILLWALLSRLPKNRL